MGSDCSPVQTATIITPGSRHAGRNVSREEKGQHFLVERPSFWTERSEMVAAAGLDNMICVINLTAAIRKIWKHSHFLQRRCFYLEDS